jgi:hypothetical protein
MAQTPGRQPVRQTIQRHKHDCGTGTELNAPGCAIS